METEDNCQAYMSDGGCEDQCGGQRRVRIELMKLSKDITFAGVMQLADMCESRGCRSAVDIRQMAEEHEKEFPKDLDNNYEPKEY